MRDICTPGDALFAVSAAAAALEDTHDAYKYFEVFATLVATQSRGKGAKGGKRGDGTRNYITTSCETELLSSSAKLCSRSFVPF